MKTGRKNKPTALKLIQGNPGNRPINEEEPQPPKVFDPDPPDHFTNVEKAKWRALTRQLSACRVLTELDLDALEMYVTHWCTMNTALRDISERGKLLQSPRGGPVWNPSWAEYKQAAKIVQSLMSEFGMTPASRTGIVASADDEGANRWSKF
jgi:P27 family predicted phage terminase small subunit